MKLNDRTFFTLGVFILVLAFLVLSLDYRPRARLVPVIIAVPTLLLTLLQLLIDMIPAVARRFSFLQEYDLFGIDTAPARRTFRGKAAPPAASTAAS